MEESRYLSLARTAFDRVVKAFDTIDPEVCDLDSAGDVLSMTCRDGVKIVLNTQRPAQQIWLAGAARAWHFGWAEDRGAWIDARHAGAELFTTLEGLLREHASPDVAL